MNIMFIKVFDNEAEANQFALIHHTKTIIHYDWDEMLNRIIKQYIVQY